MNLQKQDNLIQDLLNSSQHNDPSSRGADVLESQQDNDSSRNYDQSHNNDHLSKNNQSIDSLTRNVFENEEQRQATNQQQEQQQQLTPPKRIPRVHFNITNGSDVQAQGKVIRLGAGDQASPNRFYGTGLPASNRSLEARSSRSRSTTPPLLMSFGGNMASQNRIETQTFVQNSTSNIPIVIRSTVMSEREGAPISSLPHIAGHRPATKPLSSFIPRQASINAPLHEANNAFVQPSAHFIIEPKANHSARWEPAPNSQGNPNSSVRSSQFSRQFRNLSPYRINFTSNPAAANAGQNFDHIVITNSRPSSVVHIPPPNSTKNIVEHRYVDSGPDDGQENAALRQKCYKYQEQVEKLNSALKSRNIELERTLNARFEAAKTQIEERFTQVIQNHKSTIKKLQEQLVQAHTAADKQHHDQVERTKDQADRVEQSKKKAQEEKLLALLQSKTAYINELQAEIIHYKTQIKNFKKIIKEKEGEVVAMSLQSIEERPRQEITRQMSADTQTYIAKLEKALADKDKELDIVKVKAYSIQEELDRTLEQKMQRIKELHEQIISINKKNVNRELVQDNSRVSNQSLPSFNGDSSRPINSSQSDNEKEKILLRTISSLEEQLNIRRIQFSEDVQVQIEKLKQLLRQKQEQIQSIKDGSINSQPSSVLLQQALQQKTRQNQKLLKIINEINSSSSNNAQASQILKKKQIEVTKLKQANQTQIVKIQQLETEIRGLMDKYKTIEQAWSQERRSSLVKNSQYEVKIKQLEARISSEHKGHHHHESDVTKLKTANKQLKRRVKELEQGRSSDVGHHRTNTTPDEQDFRLNYSPSQVKIFELQAAVKARENKIKQLSNHLEQMRAKNSSSHDLITQQQIEVMRKKITQYESMLAKSNQIFNNARSREYEGINVFEQKVIYDLKNENERLRSMLGLGEQYKISAGKHKSGFITNLQKRLYEFNNKLEEMIEQNQKLSARGERHQHSHSKANKSQELVAVYEKQRLKLIRKHQHEIEALQARLIDLQRYCATLENHSQMQAQVSNLTYSFKKDDRVSEAGEGAYYKQKNKELQDRVDNLLNLNKELKDKLEQVHRPGSSHSAQYYKEEYDLLQVRYGECQGRLEQLVQENQRLKRQLNSLVGEHESRLLQYEETIAKKTNQIEILKSEQQRLSEKLEQKNGSQSKELARLRQQLRALRAQFIEIEREKNSLAQLYGQLKPRSSIHEQECIRKDQQIYSLNARIRELEIKMKSLLIMQSDNGKLAQELQALKKRLSSLSTSPETAAQIRYQLQLIRSSLLAVETLTKQHIILDDKRQLQICTQVVVTVQLGLQGCSALGAIL